MTYSTYKNINNYILKSKKIINKKKSKLKKRRSNKIYSKLKKKNKFTLKNKLQKENNTKKNFKKKKLIKKKKSKKKKLKLRFIGGANVNNTHIKINNFISKNTNKEKQITIDTFSNSQINITDDECKITLHYLLNQNNIDTIIQDIVNYNNYGFVLPNNYEDYSSLINNLTVLIEKKILLMAIKIFSLFLTKVNVINTLNETNITSPITINFSESTTSNLFIDIDSFFFYEEKFNKNREILFEFLIDQFKKKNFLNQISYDGDKTTYLFHRFGELVKGDKDYIFKEEEKDSNKMSDRSISTGETREQIFDIKYIVSNFKNQIILLIYLLRDLINDMYNKNHNGSKSNICYFELDNIKEIDINNIIDNENKLLIINFFVNQSTEIEETYNNFFIDYQKFIEFAKLKLNLKASIIEFINYIINENSDVTIKEPLERYIEDIEQNKTTFYEAFDIPPYEKISSIFINNFQNIYESLDKYIKLESIEEKRKIYNQIIKKDLIKEFSFEEILSIELIKKVETINILERLINDFKHYKVIQKFYKFLDFFVFIKKNETTIPYIIDLETITNDEIKLVNKESFFYKIFKSETFDITKTDGYNKIIFEVFGYREKCILDKNKNIFLNFTYLLKLKKQQVIFLDTFFDLYNENRIEIILKEKFLIIEYIFSILNRIVNTNGKTGKLDTEDVINEKYLSFLNLVVLIFSIFLDENGINFTLNLSLKDKKKKKIIIDFCNINSTNKKNSEQEETIKININQLLEIDLEKNKKENIFSFLNNIIKHKFFEFKISEETINLDTIYNKIISLKSNIQDSPFYMFGKTEQNKYYFELLFYLLKIKINSLANAKLISCNINYEEGENLNIYNFITKGFPSLIVLKLFVKNPLYNHFFFNLQTLYNIAKRKDETNSENMNLIFKFLDEKCNIYVEYNKRDKIGIEKKIKEIKELYFPYSGEPFYLKFQKNISDYIVNKIFNHDFHITPSNYNNEGYVDQYIKFLENEGIKLEAEKKDFLKLKHINKESVGFRYKDILPISFDLEKRKKNKNEEHKYLINIIETDLSKYITCQSPPVKSDMSDIKCLQILKNFFKMVCDFDIRIIINLCNSVDSNRTFETDYNSCVYNKCRDYWYNIYQNGNEIVFNQDSENIKIVTYKEKKNKYFNIYKEDKFIRKIHYFYDEDMWPDKEIPNIKRFINFYDNIQKIYNLYSYEKYYTLIHCAAGIGRTGTFINIDVIIKTFYKYKVKLESIKDYFYEKVLWNLRYLRKNILFVQTPDQEIFIKKFIEFYYQKKTVDEYIIGDGSVFPEDIKEVEIKKILDNGGVFPEDITEVKIKKRLDNIEGNYLIKKKTDERNNLIVYSLHYLYKESRESKIIKKGKFLIEYFIGRKVKDYKYFYKLSGIKFNNKILAGQTLKGLIVKLNETKKINLVKQIINYTIYDYRLSRNENHNNNSRGLKNVRLKFSRELELYEPINKEFIKKISILQEENNLYYIEGTEGTKHQNQFININKRTEPLGLIDYYKKNVLIIEGERHLLGNQIKI